MRPKPSRMRAETILIAVAAVVALAGLVLPALAQSQGMTDEAKRQAAEEARRELERRMRAGPTDGKPIDADDVLALRKFDPKVIYGPDGRKDYGEVEELVKAKALPPEILGLMHATVALFNRSGVTKGTEGKSTYKSSTLGADETLCEGEKFSTQKTPAFCSGALIAKDRVLTAGHCVNEVSGKPDAPKVADIAFVFGFRAKNGSDPGPDAIPESQIFHGKEVLKGGYAPKGTDWAIVQLDRQVPASLAQPITKLGKKRIEKGVSVFTMGHPSGLPVKYAPDATVHGATSGIFFVANLDTFGGNSGSPVFEHGSNALIGVMVRGAPDYKPEKLTETQKCRRAHVCPKTGDQDCLGEVVTRISEVKNP